MPRWMTLLTLTTALGSGLVAGTFFAFSGFVMPALARLPAASGVAAMNAVNTTILTSPFMPVFMGSALACLVLAGAALFAPREPSSFWLLGGALLYLVGSLGVTALRNVPLNDALIASTPRSAVSLWPHYLESWTLWNSLRAAASLLASAALILAVLAGRGE
ncbi:DUF1772 domain-containing protein [Deinococcus hopiensis]|uniref:Uncharacterized membrane protein n=1 Tax=Deinococcus hopiensis KR-140 TaxID=695939 RepID=A0A1W1VLC2_9DEIO|nr:anthrone oxygenase family protein [Deinococcus hopiensis]SMB93841.1 Uncharacterized membrane protein [Deinococcus hopiensis KR-140]